MAVPKTKTVLVPRLHREFEEPVVNVAILEAFQKPGYDRPSQDQATCCAKFRVGERYFRHAADKERKVVVLRFSAVYLDF